MLLKGKFIFRNYFNEVCYVSEAEEYFGINEYSDSIVLTKPLVYMTVQEICETHKAIIKFTKLGTILYFFYLLKFCLGSC